MRVAIDERFVERYLAPMPEFLEPVVYPDAVAAEAALRHGDVDLAVVHRSGMGPHPGWPLEERWTQDGRVYELYALAWGPGEDRAFAARVAAARLYGIRAGDPDIRIGAIGDVMTGRTIQETMDRQGYEFPFEHVVEPVRTSQIGFANIEVAITDRGTAENKVFVFRSNPAVMPYLAGFGFSLAALANNHALDFGPEGLSDMMRRFDEVGILSAGGGISREAARAPAFVRVRGITFGFLSVVDVPIEPNGYHRPHMEATEDKPGLFWAEPALVRAAVEALEPRVDATIVAMHSGYEYWTRPNDIQLAIVDAARAGGADIIIGSHSHVLQPVELEGGDLVLYSLGNGVFDVDDYDRAYAGLPSTYSAVAEIFLRGAEVAGVRFYPVVHDEQENRPLPADADARELIARNLQVPSDTLVVEARPIGALAER